MQSELQLRRAQREEALWWYTGCSGRPSLMCGGWKSLEILRHSFFEREGGGCSLPLGHWATWAGDVNNRGGWLARQFSADDRPGATAQLSTHRPPAPPATAPTHHNGRDYSVRAWPRPPKIAGSLSDFFCRQKTPRKASHGWGGEEPIRIDDV